MHFKCEHMGSKDVGFQDGGYSSPLPLIIPGMEPELGPQHQLNLCRALMRAALPSCHFTTLLLLLRGCCGSGLHRCWLLLCPLFLLCDWRARGWGGAQRGEVAPAVDTGSVQCPWM